MNLFNLLSLYISKYDPTAYMVSVTGAFASTFIGFYVASPTVIFVGSAASMFFVLVSLIGNTLANNKLTQIKSKNIDKTSLKMKDKAY